jgi:hypothetical protein
VELFHSLEQVGDDGLEVLDLGAELHVLSDQLALLPSNRADPGRDSCWNYKGVNAAFRQMPISNMPS